MKSITIMLSVFVLVGLVGFTVIEKNNFVNETPKLVEEFVPNTVTQKVVNSSVVKYSERGTMKASWYGPRFHGKKTANGEVYDQMAFTAAHKSLPFGTLLKLTNPRNGKSVIVRINDQLTSKARKKFTRKSRPLTNWWELRRRPAYSPPRCHTIMTSSADLRSVGPLCGRPEMSAPVPSVCS